MRATILALFLAACGGDKATGTGECTAPAEGPWTANGTCFGMAMTATLTLGADGCSFTFSDWDMAMSTPTGGEVTGEDVTLDWADVDDCTGTTDGTSISGTCGDGCTYELTSGS